MGCVTAEWIFAVTAIPCKEGSYKKCLQPLPKSFPHLAVPLTIMSHTQAALVISEAFGPAVVQQIPVPKPGQGEILVKVISAALNPVDQKQWQHNLYVQAYPIIPGFDIAGEVVELGPGASEDGFKVGDRVYVLSQALA